MSRRTSSWRRNWSAPAPIDWMRRSFFAQSRRLSGQSLDITKRRRFFKVSASRTPKLLMPVSRPRTAHGCRNRRRGAKQIVSLSSGGSRPDLGSMTKTSGSNTTEICTACDRSTAWLGAAQHLQAVEGLGHHPAATLRQGDQALAQTGEVLLDDEAPDRASLTPVAILKMGARSRRRQRIRARSRC